MTIEWDVVNALTWMSKDFAFLPNSEMPIISFTCWLSRSSEISSISSWYLSVAGADSFFPNVPKPKCRTPNGYIENQNTLYGCKIITWRRCSGRTVAVSGALFFLVFTHIQLDFSECYFLHCNAVASASFYMYFSNEIPTKWCISFSETFSFRSFQQQRRRHN